MDRHRKDKQSVSGSALAQMGKCERQIAFENLYGKRSSPELEGHRGHGNARHDAFYRESLRDAAGIDTDARNAKPWCFLSTAVYGSNAPETVALRRLRDGWLRHSRAGRAFIGWYYRASPAWCARLAPMPRMCALVALLLRPAVWLARALDRLKGGRHV